ncbi:MAG: DUF3450 domain-containing protein [Proteobacteria bacterium]|nr:DUF3450 domain-containing protein [Pseudomonadota bacterium]MBU1386439.1 DUF3450 domain-containing protein [Pseudomonadota bacterium]MBU1544550.1 DUF3450 domain-containing protein [Pseudomonadota bacterium]MBU2481000.1 DUF3450 domain-containing protein [Pseudomonadota bacterium]
MKFMESEKMARSYYLTIKKMVRMTIPGMILILAMAFTGTASTADGIEKPVKQSIDTQQETQENQENWEAKKAELTARYDQLLSENETLNDTVDVLSGEQTKHQDLNRSLEQEKLANIRIQKEILPFLKDVFKRLEFLVKNDSPFLINERNSRLERLSRVMEDVDVSIGEKYRKVMEALFVEAEYGNTIEVYQDKIHINSHEVLGNIFRLGRISEFFLSLDGRSAAVFNVKDNQWQALDETCIPDISRGVEMAAKRQPVEILTLPVGRLAKQ